MAKRRSHRRSTKRTVRHVCAKRKGSPRFSKHCKNEFRQCMRSELKSTGSMKSAGESCMQVINQCRARARGGR